MPDLEQKSPLWKDYTLNAAILNALLDKPEDSKEWLKQFLTFFPDDQTAKDIKSAIE